MRIKLISMTACLLIAVAGNSSAQAMGYISWSSPDPATAEFSQNIQINNSEQFVSWKAQVYIGKSNTAFGIALNSRTGSNSIAEFGAYYDSGVTAQSFSSSICLPTPNPGTSMQFVNCSIPFKFSAPTSINLSIERDLSDLSGQTWTGSITDNKTGITSLIGKFLVLESSASITKVLEYTFPYSINECAVNSPTLEAIYWAPTSISNKYHFDGVSNSQCGAAQFTVPSVNANADGIKIILSPLSTELVQYHYSINEILFKDVWKQAFELGSSETKMTADAQFAQYKSTSDLKISELQTAISELSNSQMVLKDTNAQLTSQLINANSLYLAVKSKLYKICQIKPKPKNC